MNPGVSNHFLEKFFFQFFPHQKTELRQKTFLAEKNSTFIIKILEFQVNFEVYVEV